MKGPDEPQRHFAEKIARLQAERGLSNEDLAARAKLGVGDLEAILRGEGRVDLDAIFLLAGALGVAPGELLEGIVWVPDEVGRGGGYRADDSSGD